MQEAALRSVLLVKAIEEVDRAGTLVPLAERVDASREARRMAGNQTVVADDGGTDATLKSGAQRMLAVRADTLLQRVIGRHPFVATLKAAAGGPAWVGWSSVLFGALLGFFLSALDGTQRINIIAPGLIGLALWNIGVYCAVLAGAWRGARGATPRARPLATLVARNGLTRVSRLIVKSAAFNALLAEALRRFTGEWFDAAKPLLVARATRIFHLCAAAVGVGLIAGLYLRGIALDYRAGWESTFLHATQVRALLSVLYGPAAALTGIALPDPAHLEAIRWPDATGAGGERAGEWIHLLAMTVMLIIVLPRLLLALWSTLSVWRWSLRAPLPPALTVYYRNVFGSVDSTIGRGIAMVLPYAYEPAAAVVERLRTLLPAGLGDKLAVDFRAPVAYGDEDALLRHLGDRGGGVADALVLLFNLSSTPEDENHGAVLSGVRDWLAANRRDAQLLVLVDESPYAARMAAQGGAQERIAERRRAWQDFVGARGLTACPVDLCAPLAGESPDSQAGRQPDRQSNGQSNGQPDSQSNRQPDPLVARLRAALWQPEPR